MRRDSTPSRILQRPLALIATAIGAAAVFALFLTVISFGILAGVGAIVIGLTAMLGGLWLLLNRAGNTCLDCRSVDPGAVSACLCLCVSGFF